MWYSKNIYVIKEWSLARSIPGSVYTWLGLYRFSVDLIPVEPSEPLPLLYSMGLSQLVEAN